jgi:TonB family protein
MSLPSISTIAIKSLGALTLAFALLTPAPARADSDDVLSMQYADLPKAWTRERGRDQGESMFPPKYRAGCARVSFIVERTGKISTIKVLGTYPDTIFGDVVRDMLKSWRFQPTAINAQRMPVYTEHTFVMVAPKADRVIGSNRREKISPTRVANQCALDSLRRAQEP